jgi:hypothetical protein
MNARAKVSLSENRPRFIPVAIVLVLLAGLIVSIVRIPSAQADYNTGCGYGYNSSATGFGSGPGSSYAYGSLKNGSFGYGYGNEVCPLAVSTASLPGGRVGTSYSQTLSGTGGTSTFTWQVSSGTMPSGLTLSTAGSISGTPTASGTSSFVVTMTDGHSQTTTASLSIAIAAKVSGPKVPRCTRIVGQVVTGRTRTIVIIGSNFYGQPRIRSTSRFTTAKVRQDSGRTLRTVVTVRSSGHRGRYVFTVTDANGRSCRIGYLQH